MGQPVKLSNELVDDARAVVPFTQRSIAEQIEFWAGLGKSIEPLLRGDRSMLLRRTGSERPLSRAIAEVDTAKGRRRVEAYLKKRPFPHYKPVLGNPELLRRIEADGSEVIGRFVGRDFVEVEGER
ncbi:ParD-like family protein [Aporhodopirellula aestuarii]|uniref:ParD-like family protein n=1 Tax=Aporhodopirellula aestuarii TaxID=2950107 RepID=A0ABT0UDG6_9BACT|nr:ParD-like family protein [Aporhodopirellula aestuarii]MCM2374423.1 ParD-like family protein [Aporhodopirellula aestuarii]